MSSNELSAKLAAKGFDESTVQNTIAYLIEKKWYNEHAAARELAETKVRSALVGPYYLRQFLYRKQFSMDMIDQIVDAAYRKHPEQELAQQNVQKKLPYFLRKYRDDTEKQFKIKMALKQYLARRGFSQHICDGVADDAAIA